LSKAETTKSQQIGFKRGKVFIEKEVLKYRRGPHGKPWHFLDYSKGIGSAIKNEQDYESEKWKAKEEREEQSLGLLHDPNPRPLLCIEEPENYLYPTLLREFVEELREYAVRGGQVFVSTHSPDFVEALKIEELFLVKKEQGSSRIFPATKYDEQTTELYENGCELGWLWQHEYFKGINP